MNYIFSLMSGICLLFFFSNTGYAQDNKAGDIIQGPFKTDLFPGGEIFFENGQQNINECHSIDFILKYKNNNQFKITKIDEYEIDPFCPELLSVFFYKLHNQQYIFTIIKRHFDVLTEHVDMDSYDILAYTKNNNGVLVKDKKISDNPDLTGEEGLQFNKKVTFKYKTAADVKRYLRQKYQ